MPAHTCPICRKPSAERGANSPRPFCSERCRLVDLGKWLGEEYRVPDTETPVDPEQNSSD